MSSGTSILKSIIQAVDPKDRACFEYHSGPWRIKTVVVGTLNGLKFLRRSVFIGHKPGLYNLGSFLNGIPRVLLNFNLSATLNIIFMKQLKANIGAYGQDYINLNVKLRGWDIEKSNNLASGLTAIEHKNIIGILRLQREGEDQFCGIIRGWSQDYINLNVKLRGWDIEKSNNLASGLTAIEHKNIIGALRAQWKGEDQFCGIIRGWGANEFDPPDYLGGNLLAVIQPYVKFDLFSFLQTTQPINLVACLKVWPYRNLRSDIQGYAVLDLLARIRIFTESVSNVSASVVGYCPANLMALLFPSRSGCYNINASIFAQRLFDLSARMNYVYKSYLGLCSIIEGLPMYLLNASVVGWAERNLSASISTVAPPGYLGATIVQHGMYKGLLSAVAGFVEVATSVNLRSYLSGWAQSGLTSFISSIESVSLIASIISKGGAKDISAYIKVREIIFSELYRFSTISTADLRAYVGFSLCSIRTPRSAYVSLLSLISAVPIYDLGAVIKGIKTIYSGTKDLGVFIGYTNEYSMLVKFLSFKHSTSVSEVIRINPAFFKDSLNITFKIIKGRQDLKTYLTTVPHNSSLSATIRSLLLIVHGSGTSKVLTEELVELDGYNRIWSEYVDVYLHSEKPIYYADGEVFAQHYGDPIFSFLFKRASSLGIQYSYVLPYDMFFASTDEAIRYGFSKISGRTAYVGLGAVVETNVKHLKLNAKIECKKNISLYLGSPFTYLKTGTVSFMGTCVNNTLYKSKLNVFGGVQDITSSVSAVVN